MHLTSRNSLPKRALFWVLLLGFALNLLILAWVATSHPQYLINYKTNPNPDAHHYLVLGKNVWTHGVFSRQAEPPFLPDMVRTPVYPLMAGGLLVLFNAVWPIYLFQIFLFIGTGIIIYFIGKKLFNRAIGGWASLLYICNPMLIIQNFEAMSEPMFIFFSTLFLLFWLKFLQKIKEKQSPGMILTLGLGMLLGILILTRPIALYLPLLVGLIQFSLILIFKNVKALLATTLLIVTPYLVISPWILRNTQTFDLPKVSMADSINLAYMGGAGVYQILYDIEREEAQEKISKEFNLPPYLEVMNPWLTNKNLKELDHALRSAGKKIILDHPLLFIQSTCIGITKCFFSHNTERLATATNQKWTPPQLNNLLDGNIKNFTTRLMTNHPFLIFIFILEYLYLLMELLFIPIGIFVALSNPKFRLLALAILALFFYYILGIIMMGPDSYFRFRTVIDPLIFILMGVGLTRLNVKK